MMPIERRLYRRHFNAPVHESEQQGRAVWLGYRRLESQSPADGRRQAVDDFLSASLNTAAMAERVDRNPACSSGERPSAL